MKTGSDGNLWPSSLYETDALFLPRAYYQFSQLQSHAVIKNKSISLRLHITAVPCEET